MALSTDHAVTGQQTLRRLLIKSRKCTTQNVSRIHDSKYCLKLTQASFLCFTIREIDDAFKMKILVIRRNWSQSQGCQTEWRRENELRAPRRTGNWLVADAKSETASFGWQIKELRLINSHLAASHPSLSRWCMRLRTWMLSDANWEKRQVASAIGQNKWLGHGRLCGCARACGRVYTCVRNGEMDTGLSGGMKQHVTETWSDESANQWMMPWKRNMPMPQFIESEFMKTDWFRRTPTTTGSEATSKCVRRLYTTDD